MPPTDTHRLQKAAVDPKLRRFRNRLLISVSRNAPAASVCRQQRDDRGRVQQEGVKKNRRAPVLLHAVVRLWQRSRTPDRAPLRLCMLWVLLISVATIARQP